MSGTTIIGGSDGEEHTGTPFADSISGNDGDDTISGLGGGDALDGGPGADWLLYENDSAGITVDLAGGTVQGAAVGLDFISTFENVVGGAGDDSLSHGGDGGLLFGNGGDDDIGAGGGDDTVAGGAGADTLDGGDGADWLAYASDSTGVAVNLGTGATGGGDAAGDSIAGFENVSGGTGNDNLVGDDGDNVILGGAGADTIAGLGGNDWIEGQAGSDSVDAGSGDDVVFGDSPGPVDTTADTWADTLIGGDGFDYIQGAGGGDLIFGDSPDGAGSGQDEVHAGYGNDTVYGGADNDDLDGEAGSDLIEGGAGDDFLHGERAQDGAGDDTLSGGSGNDTLYGDAGGDSLDGGADNDWLSYEASADAVTVDLGAQAAAGGDAAGDTIAGFENLQGGIGNDWLIGDDNANAMSGGDGDDSVVGAAGDDTLHGGAGADALEGGDGSDWLSYAGDAAGVAVNLASSVASGGDAVGDSFSGFENVQGGAGNDSLVGDAVSNRIDGGDGEDTLSTGNDNDTVIGGTGSDLIDAGTGNDSVFGGDTTPGSTDAADSVYLDDSVSPYDEGSPGAGGDDTYLWQDGMGSDTVWGGAGTDMLSILGDTTGYTIARNSSRDSVNDWYVYKDGSDTLTLFDFEVACFAAGTRIATARGEVAVEALRLGDLVVTLHGRGAPLQPVTWIGHRRTDIAHHPEPAAVAPVLICAGALGAGVPARDLRVSPDHAMLLDGRLVPAKLLANGVTILQEPWCPEVTYFHVELAAHGVLLAEGAATESYVDAGNRDMFDNGAAMALFPDFGAAREGGDYDHLACFPVLRHGQRLEAIRERLARHAAAEKNRAEPGGLRPVRRQAF